MPQAGSLPEALFNDEVENSMNNKIAIDFGTSRTKAAYYDTNRKNAELVRLGRGVDPIPSLFHRDKNGETYIGEDARDKLKDEPKGSIAQLKLQLQQRRPLRPWGKRVLPEDLLVCLFKELRETVATTVPLFYEQGPPLSVVLTTTLYYSFAEREVLKSAAEKVGFEPPDFLPEPEAAARAWLALGAPKDADRFSEVVVLDCGGGTLDWAYLHKDRDGKFHLNPHLPAAAAEIGGEDVDEALLKRYVIPKLPREDAVDTVLLREEVRACKEAYCRGQRNLRVRVGPGQSVTLDGSDIQAVIDETFIKPACEAIEPYLRKVKEATGRGIPPILLVGGSASLKGLKERLAERFGCEVLSWHRGEFATVLGAAVPLPSEQERDATYERAESYLKTDKFDEALVEFQAVLKLAPHHPDAADSHAGIAEAHLGLGNLEEAAKAAGRVKNHERALQRLERVMREYHKRGIERMKSGDYTDACDEFEKALTITPNDMDTLLSSAEAYLELREFQEAEKAVQKVLKHDPRSPRAQGLMHKITAESGRQSATAKPAASRQASAEAQEQEFDATYARAVAYVNDEEFDKALVEFQEVLKIAPHHANSHAGIAAAHLALVNLEEATDAANEAIKLEPNHELALRTQEGIIQVHRRQGAACMKDGNYADARDEFKKALKIDPLHAEACVDSARAYLKSDEIEKAENAARKVLDRDSDFSPAQQVLGQITLAKFGSEGATAEPTAEDQSKVDADAYIASGGNMPRTEAAPKPQESTTEQPVTEAAPKPQESTTEPAGHESEGSILGCWLGVGCILVLVLAAALRNGC